MTDVPNDLFQMFGAAAGYTFPLPCPAVDPDADPLVYVRMNRDWLAYVIAACMPLTLLETWRETDPATLSLTAARANLLIDMLMTLLCDPICVGALRLAGNTLQHSPDGGVTWQGIDNAGGAGGSQDPRLYEPLLPPRGGDNIPCLAAVNATACFVELHREIVAWYDASLSGLVLLGALALILGVFFPVSWMVFGLSLSSVSLSIILLTYSAALNNTAFTSTIQDELTCILYCHADSNGQWDAAALNAIIADVQDKSGDMWRLIELYIGQIGGFAGLNNAGVTTTVASYDCSECPCLWCYLFDFTAGAQGWEGLYNTTLHADGWEDGNLPDAAYIHYVAGVTTHLQYVTFYFNQNWTGNLPALWVQSGDGETTYIEHDGADGNAVRFLVDADVNGLRLVADRQKGAVQRFGAMRLTAVRLQGKDTNPFGIDNCT
jgi:hypothetical protein